MRPTIEITISPQGQSQIEAKGFVGATCHSATARFAAELGAKLSEQRPPEYYQMKQTTTSSHVRQI